MLKVSFLLKQQWSCSPENSETGSKSLHCRRRRLQTWAELVSDFEKLIFQVRGEEETLPHHSAHTSIFMRCYMSIENHFHRKQNKLKPRIFLCQNQVTCWDRSHRVVRIGAILLTGLEGLLHQLKLLTHYQTFLWLWLLLLASSKSQEKRKWGSNKKFVSLTQLGHRISWGLCHWQTQLVSHVRQKGYLLLNKHHHRWDLFLQLGA